MARRVQRPSRNRQRGMILLVVLLIVSLLALLGASFSYRMNADLAALKAKQDIQQAELAARSGIERVIWVLRDKRTDVEQWYNNPKWFRRIPIWMPGKVGGSESIADQEPVPGVPAWRFSIVSYKIDGDTAKIRYGITDEASKINLNTATRMQLIRLFEQVKPEDATPEALADCLIDWRDKDDVPNSAYGAESSYYNTLEPRYKAKNKPLDTVEELLMIKGFNGRILYGEDYNRNGYLDDNEDDGEEEGAFPPDNGDGILNRGILPFVTVYSWDWNTGNDNARRVNINLENFGKPEDLPEYIAQELSPQVIEFIAEARKRGYVFKSPAELLGLEVYEDGSSNYDQLWRSFSRTLRRENRVPDEDQVPEEEEESADGEGDDTEGGGNQDGGNQDGRGGGNDQAGGEQGNEQQDEEPRARGNRRGGRDNADAGNDPQAGDADDASAEEKRDARRRQSAGVGAGQQEDRLPSQRERRRNAAQGGDQNASGGGNADDDSGEQRGSRRRGSRGRDADNQEGENAEDGNGRRRGGRRGGSGEEGASEGGGGGRSRGTPIVSPATVGDMPVIMDRLTTAVAPAIAGLINVNTAPVQVLSTIPGLPPDKAEAIVGKREQVTGPEKMTTGWLVSTGALDAETFALISNQVTTRSIQFTIDAIGFGDHTGAMKRIEAVVEMRGQISQIKYYRDISSLGIGFPIHDDQRSEGFAFSDR